MLKDLPDGLQTFKNIIEGNYIYVDKTQFIYKLVKPDRGVYFLSRPRRFGKSLLLSTLSEIFQGNKELFNGLWLYNSDYEWKKYPVIHISFAGYDYKNTPLHEILNEALFNAAREHGISLTGISFVQRFKDLIYELRQQNPVVILIDEYDKPIIEWIEEPEKAIQNRDILKSFYEVIKNEDKNLRFIFLTGVSKFSKTGIFSGLNNLDDITMVPEYSDMLGITEQELLENFKDHIQYFVEKESIPEEILMQKIRRWYNGFCFSKNGVNVYNPYSTLLLLKHRQFEHHWFETGTPTFLINLIKTKQFEPSDIPAKKNASAFTTYEPDKLDVLPILFQTGYLTIKSWETKEDNVTYLLDYPNFEVKDAFLEQLLKSFASRKVSNVDIWELIDSLRIPDMEKFFEILTTLFSQVIYDLHIPQEKYYQTIFFLIFRMIGLRTDTEVHTNKGRIDVTIVDKFIFIFEFKFGGTKEDALKQIKEKQYAQPFTGMNKDIYLVGAVFEDKNIKEWAVEKSSNKFNVKRD